MIARKRWTRDTRTTRDISANVGARRVWRGVSWLTCGAVHAAFALATGLAFAQPAKPTAQLTIVDPNESKGTAVQTWTDDYRQRLAAQIDVVKPGAALHIESASLLGPDGVAVDLAVAALGRSGKSIEVVPLATGTSAIVEIDLSAKLPRLGEYTGYVTLRYGDEKPVVKPLRVNRTMIDLPIEVLGVERVSNQNCLTCWREATVWLTLQAPPDRDLIVTPTLAELALNRTGKEKVQAIVGGQAISVGGGDAVTNIALRSGETKRVAVELSGLGETGEYAGKVRFAAGGFKQKDKDFTLLVKDAWWFAVIPIFLGAIVSMWLRRYGTDKRPRLIIRQRIAQLGEQIDALRRAVATADETENRVLDAFNRRLIALYGEATGADKLPDGWVTTGQATLRTVAAKLPNFTLWVNARRLLAALDPSIDAKEIQRKLLAIQTALEADADLSDAQKSELAQLPAQIVQLRRDATLAALVALQHEFDELRKIVLPGRLVAPEWAEANAQLEQAGEQARADAFEATHIAYEAARKVFAGLLLDDFADRVAAGTPVGLEGKQWAELKPKIERLLERAKAATDAKGALDGYAQTYGVYLNEQIGVLLPKLLDEPAINAKAQKLSPDKQQPFLDLAKDTTAKLRDAAASLTRGELRQAYAKHLEALSGWQSLNDQLPGGAKMGGVERGAAGSTEVAPGAEPPPGAGQAPVLIPAVFGRVADSATELAQRTTTLDTLVDLVAIALTAVLGVQFVWGPNPTWGGLSDSLFALLWGLGLHQVSGFTFDGVLGLREKLLK